MISYKKLTAVWIVLLVLTVVTVAVTRFELGMWKVWTALGIATLKSGLVVAFFMHMKYEPFLLKLLLSVALITLVTFIGLTFSDIYYRY